MPARHPSLRIAALCLALGACTPVRDADTNTNTDTNTVTITIIGTNDVHGAMTAAEATGGLQVFSGYLDNLRKERARDGAVLLLDAGDMWQGTLESNLNEGASVVAIYNALGYDAAAIGNHEFDFGPAGLKAVPQAASDDPQGALKARAAAARFPLLAANTIDSSTGAPVDWPNVRPTTIIEAAGVRFGIIGAITESTPFTTIAANTAGLSFAPLARSIALQARALRDQGVDVVIVTVHAGGRCENFSDPRDLSSCRADSEIFNAANALEPGLVDVIVAGHTHRRVAHYVNGIAIVSSLSGLQTFDRVDLRFDLGTRRIASTQIHPPQSVCEFREPATAECAAADSGAPRATYADAPVVPVPAIARLVSAAVDEIDQYKQRPVGITVEETMRRAAVPESAIGNLMTDILLDMTPGADIAIHNNVGGIRADLLAGPLTFGEVFEVFPFDNRVVELHLSGSDVRRLFREQLLSRMWRAGVSGATVRGVCGGDGLDVVVTLADGRDVQDDDEIVVVSNDFLATGGDRIFTPVMPAGGYDLPAVSPLVRDQIAEWMAARGGVLHASDFYDPTNPRYVLPGPVPVSCEAPSSP